VIEKLTNEKKTINFAFDFCKDKKKWKRCFKKLCFRLFSDVLEEIGLCFLHSVLVYLSRSSLFRL